ncbi:MAG: hypothetical protein RJA52_1519 [Bacteroidota bacterium]
MKNYFLFILLVINFLSVHLIGQELTIHAHITDCTEEPGIFIFDGTAFVKTGFSKFNQTNNILELKHNNSKPGFFYFGSNPNSLKLIFLGGNESSIDVYGSCNSIPEVTVKGSEAHLKFEELIKKGRELNVKSGRTKAVLQRASGEEERNLKYEELTSINQEKKELIVEATKFSAFLAEIIRLITYLDYIPGKNSQSNEVIYFMEEFFSQSDLSQLTIENNPFLFEAFRNFTNTLTEIRVPQDIMEQQLQVLLQRIPSQPQIRNMVLGGIISALGQKEHPSFLKYAQALHKDLMAQNAPTAGLVKQKIDEVGAFMPGGTPPDFTQLSPEGEAISLSQLRGKYLLLDFWASWCGPCRRENPNVVRLYNLYKEKGFEILGISLDNDRNRWLNAIEKDQLTWPHVSDLKGWSNDVAKLYGVTSIPKTILLDPEGKIVALNLRGEALENVLKELFD